MKKKELKTLLLLSSFAYLLGKTNMTLENNNTSNKEINKAILLDENLIDETISIQKNDVTIDKSPSIQALKLDYIEEPMDHYNYIEETYGNYINQIAFVYGLDPTLVKALLSQEYGIKNNNIAQIKGDIWENKTISAYNFSKEEWESVFIDSSCFEDPYLNIRIGCMILQDSMVELNGNILAGLQGYNYGPHVVKGCIKKYASDHGLNFEDVLNDPYHIDWISYIEAYQNGTYGDPEYIEHVLEHIHEDAYTLSFTNEDDSKNYISIEKTYTK